MKPHMPEFPAFYRAFNGRDPFPWQARLAEQVAATEQWPREIGVPTGLGKTACLEIAVWWLASQAHRAATDRTAPTRIWWVVNRRLLVDSTASHAKSLAEALTTGTAVGATSDNDRVAITQVGDRLQSLSADPDAPPLEVITLRGGVASRTPTDPSRPTLVMCTLPMYGSRLLFRGYGSRLRPVDAAMAGTDSLVLVDEAHLVPHLRSLLSALADCTPAAKPILAGRRSSSTLVALTATGESQGADRFDLTEEDERNEIVRQRLDAYKPLHLLIKDSEDSATHLANATIKLMNEAKSPASFLVFANSPGTARDTFGRLQEPGSLQGTPSEVVLLTGRTREREAERIRARVLDPEHGMPATRTDRPRERHLVVVATQTLEVGADLDAEFLVTEACGVRALTQRLGRLNRLGRHEHARAVYVHSPPPYRWKNRRRPQAPVSWPIYRGEPAEVLKRLQKARRKGNRPVDLSPRSVANVLGPPRDDPGRAPEILPGILWEWIKTTTPPEGEAPVEPYFNGIAVPGYAVSVIWRAHVPEPGQRLWPRPTDREAVDIPLSEFRDALDDDEVIHRLEPDGVTLEAVSSRALRPGDEVLLTTDRGLYDNYGWNPAATESVVDVSLAGQGLPLNAAAIGRLCNVPAGQLLAIVLGDSDEDIDETDYSTAVADLLHAVRDADTPAGWDSAEWRAFTASLQPKVVSARSEVPWLRARNPAPESRIAEFDETSLGATAKLDSHGRAVGRRAAIVADCLGIPDGLRDVIALAGTLHDIGKADARFQRWLDPDGNATTLMAKSNAPRHRWESMRAAAGWPRGGRHEDLSARLVRAWLQERPEWRKPILQDLLIHLVISHHGKGRPMVPPVRDGTQTTVSGDVSGSRVVVAADLSRVDWDQPARFLRLNRHFGPWGLALLESIVIRSDHTVSARGNVDLITP